MLERTSMLDKSKELPQEGQWTISTQLETLTRPQNWNQLWNIEEFKQV